MKKVFRKDWEDKERFRSDVQFNEMGKFKQKREWKNISSKEEEALWRWLRTVPRLQYGRRDGKQ